MATFITAAMLYDLVQCPHRVTMDLFGDPVTRDEISPFVQLLWEKGTLYEKEVIEGLEEPFVDLSPYAGDEKKQKTLEAMERREPLIYSGRLQADDLLGNPDLLSLVGDDYVAGDIKSGTGLEGDPENGKPKKHYAVQIALYTDLLERLGKSAGRTPFIWDIHVKSIVAGAAIALAATIGSASAADQLSTLKGVSADVMTPQDMAEVVGGTLDGLHLEHSNVPPGPGVLVAPAAVLTVAGKPFLGNAEGGLNNHLTVSGANAPGGTGVDTPGQIGSLNSVVGIICTCEP